MRRPLRRWMLMGLTVCGLAVAGWQLPTALSAQRWRDDAAHHRSSIGEIAGDLDSVRVQTKATEDDLADERAANRSASNRLAKQRKTVAGLENRVHDLGGEP